MKTVVVFSAYYYPHLGGIERYIDNMMHQFIKKKMNVILVTSNYDNFEDIEMDSKLKIIRLPVYKMFKNRYPIIKHNKKERTLLKELDNYKIDAIIVNTRFHLTSHIGAKYGKKHNIPVYLIEHGSQYVTVDNKYLDFFANRYEDFLTWRIKKKVKGFYGVSNACSSWLVNFNIKASGTWYNSIDIEQKLPKKDKHTGIYFMYAGRLIKQKGVENILKAFTKLEKKYKDINLFIAGDGPELEYYRNNYKSKNIKLLGRLTYAELLNYYAKADVFLYPPLWPEGLPTSILEAGLMKCAVIGTDQGGIREIIDKENGIIISGDIQSLEDSMAKLITDSKLRNKLQEEIYKTVINKFSWNVTSEIILNDIEK